MKTMILKYSRSPARVNWLWNALLLSLCVTQVARAQESQIPAENHERWYQVEMIVFARSENPAQQESWPHNIQLSYPADVTALKPAETGDNSGFSLLKTSERQLNPQVSSIAKSGSYSLLFHQAWRQLISAQTSSILINGGKIFNNHYELEGSIDLSVAQYLKLQTNLWLTQFTPVNSVNDLGANWPELPPLPHTDITPADQAPDYLVKRIVKLKQERSIRSQEIHYIDHPLLGIIIKIVPYSPAAQ
ncbi:MAG TPA: CsiV family protein [Cellvibrio sp.]|nr:CsiV family protein [Cellvibrio sp.]